MRDSLALQTDLVTSRRVSERVQVEQAMAASLNVAQPPVFSAEQLGITNAVVHDCLMQSGLVEVEVRSDGDCLFTSAIRAAELVGVPLRERLSVLGVVVPVDEAISSSHLRRGVAQWLRQNKELFGHTIGDPDSKRRGLVEFTQPDARTNSPAAAARTGQSWQTLQPVWLDFEQTLEALEKPGQWSIRYWEPCQPTDADPDLRELPYLFDYLMSVLPFVLGASIRVLLKSALLGAPEHSDLMALLEKGGSFMCDPHQILANVYKEKEKAAALAEALQLPPQLQLPLLTLIQKAEQNHWNYAKLMDADDASSSAADSGSGGQVASPSSSAPSARAAAADSSAAASAPLPSAAASSAAASSSAPIDVLLIKRIAFLSKVSRVRRQQLRPFAVSSLLRLHIAHCVVWSACFPSCRA